jgi:D-alanyl-D-alanine carboxypeptidase/D-alanyl-D-alanine-endopeptidase (penicillin-binding protein 4)
MSVKNYWLIALICLFPLACSEPPVIAEHPIKKTEAAVILPEKKPSLPPLLTELPDEVASLLQASGLSADGLSVYIQSLANPRPLLAFNADIPRNPASVMKLVTTYSALGTLGPDYRWPVELYTTGNIQGDTLTGDLILKGYGDPNFKEPDLHHLLDDLRIAGIKKIAGNLVFDNSYFSIPKQDSGAFDGKRYALYNAQSDALLYNEGISFFIIQGHEVFSPNPAKNVNIINNLHFKDVPCSGRYTYPKMGIKHNEEQIDVMFEGSYSSRCEERKYVAVITDPANMLYGTLTKMWTEDMGGIIEGGAFKQAPTPKEAKLLARTESIPVSDVLPMINKKSNNVMAQQLFLSIGAKQPGETDTTEKAYNAIQQWFKSRGLDFPELRMENGSGLSRHGQVSARHIAELLIDAYNSPYHDALVNSLPIMGVDGTLKNRMKGTHVAGHAHLKTGTLNNAKAIAGYVTSNDGETYVVSILHNDEKARYKARPIHDKLIEWTARQTAQTSKNSVYFE